MDNNQHLVETETKLQQLSGANIKSIKTVTVKNGSDLGYINIETDKGILLLGFNLKEDWVVNIK